MVGVITTIHLFTKSRLIIQEFGPRCFLRCVWRAFTSQSPVTFLECIDPAASHFDQKRHGRAVSD